jgi:hypothetical protein
MSKRFTYIAIILLISAYIQPKISTFFVNLFQRMHSSQRVEIEKWLKPMLIRVVKSSSLMIWNQSFLRLMLRFEAIMLVLPMYHLQLLQG